MISVCRTSLLIGLVVCLERESNLKVAGSRHGKGEEEYESAALLKNEFNAASLPTSGDVINVSFTATAGP